MKCINHLSPRTYKMARRKVAADHNRLRILQAARDLLLAPDFREFSMETVAKAAGVSRLTVYYQFNSRAGLLEALYDFIARSAHLGERIGEVFRTGNVAQQQIHLFIDVFLNFWASNREVIRRLHALGAIDSEIGQGLRARNERRRNGLRVLVDDHARMNYRYTPLQIPVMLDILHMITSFETFDALSVGERSLEEVRKILVRMADQALGMWPPAAHPVATTPVVKIPIKPARKQRRKRR